MQNRFMHGGEVEATRYLCFYGQSSNYLLITLNVTWINSSSEKGVCHWIKSEKLSHQLFLDFLSILPKNFPIEILVSVRRNVKFHFSPTKEKKLVKKGGVLRYI